MLRSLLLIANRLRFGNALMIAVTAMRNTVATAYGNAATHAALFTADPGATGTATGEVTGGAPAYNRRALTWGAPSGGVITVTPAAFDVGSGNTITFAGVASSITPGAATILDKTSVTSQAFASQGTYTLTLTYTQT